jgi:hypothetical protein
VKLVVTIDVEEEGLFRNRYEGRDVPVRNVVELLRLDPIVREWAIVPTLLVTDPVARHGPHRDLLLRLRREWGAEIGAHLHPWNTPPLQAAAAPEPVSSERMPRELLSAKLQALLQSIAAMGVTPTAFRMGRYNMGPQLFSLLEGSGIRVDSSIAPMRRFAAGPDHLAAPVDPYFPDPAAPTAPGASPILEVPLTIVPLTPRLGAVLDRVRQRTPLSDRWIVWAATRLGSLPAQPMWTGLERLKAAVRLHRHRGGQVLTIGFHSSELMPGGCPRHPTVAHVDRFLDKLRRFFGWLHREATVESLTLSELADRVRDRVPPREKRIR